MSSSIDNKSDLIDSDLQKYVFENSNPHPINVLIIVVIIIVVLYLIHRLFIKPSMSGKWIISDKWSRVTISHNKMDNYIIIDDKVQPIQFKLHDNLLFNDKTYGIWDYEDTIVLVPRLNFLDHKGTKKALEPIYLHRE
jgi:hypothetical protein